MSGWIKLHRQIKEHWVFQDPIKLRWWMIMLLEVNYKEGRMPIGNTLRIINQGQSTKSLRTWADLFNCSPRTVDSFFKLLENENMITREVIGKSKHTTTLINITNFSQFQCTDETQESTQTSTQSKHKSLHKLPTIEEGKESKEGKERKNIYIPPTIFEVTAYFEENGYKKEAAEKAFKYYDVANWVDSKGNKVKNWKQKMRGVWFKDENKSTGDQPRKMVY